MMATNNPPIVFCHYGSSPYLYYTLRCAQYFNPNKRVVLIGDEANKAIAKAASVMHVNMDQLKPSPYRERFERVFKFVAGAEHGREAWVKFVFKRWFYVYEFITQQAHDAFWHFDSDNLIISSLSQQERKFANVDLTEQCNGMCINGFVNNKNIIEAYLEEINNLFEDEAFMQEQAEDMLKNPTYAYTEMRAYKAYKQRYSFKAVRLNSLIQGESFDDCICQDHGYARYENANYKKIFFDDTHAVYFHHLSTDQMVRVNSINLSWVPDYFFPSLCMICKKSKYKTASGKNLRLFDYTIIPLSWRIKQKINRVLRIHLY